MTMFVIFAMKFLLFTSQLHLLKLSLSCFIGIEYKILVNILWHTCISTRLSFVQVLFQRRLRHQYLFYHLNLNSYINSKDNQYFFTFWHKYLNYQLVVNLFFLFPKIIPQRNCSKKLFCNEFLVLTTPMYSS